MTARTRHPLEAGWAIALAAFGTLVLGSCATPAPPPPPPAPPPVVIRPPPPPPPPPQFQGDWRDAPQTPGDWRWSNAGGRSIATYGQAGQAPVATLACDRAAARVLLMRAGNAAQSVPMAVRTTFTLRPLTSDPALGQPGWVVVGLAATDPLLDAIAFSRGRFTIEVAGLETLYLPSWPELSRVIEDCR